MGFQEKNAEVERPAVLEIWFFEEGRPEIERSDVTVTSHAKHSKWQFINNWFFLLFFGLHYPKWLPGNDIHCLKYEYTKISWIRIQIHYQLKFDMPQAGYSCISMISQQLKKKSYSCWENLEVFRELGWCSKQIAVFRLLSSKCEDITSDLVVDIQSE